MADFPINIIYITWEVSRATYLKLGDCLILGLAKTVRLHLFEKALITFLVGVELLFSVEIEDKPEDHEEGT